MAETAWTRTVNVDANVYTWGATTESDTFKAIPTSGFTVTDQIFDFAGTFGGATVTIHGIVDPNDTYAAVPDKNGSTAGITAAGRIIIADQYHALKPVASGGTSQSLTGTARIGKLPLR